jgi:hypothetical protein
MDNADTLAEVMAQWGLTENAVKYLVSLGAPFLEEDGQLWFDKDYFVIWLVEHQGEFQDAQYME